jgi:hypothetical protein
MAMTRSSRRTQSAGTSLKTAYAAGTPAGRREYKLTREEQETVINCSAADREWTVLTSDPRIIRKLERQGYRTIDAAKNPWGYQSYRVPFGRISIRKRETQARTPRRMPAGLQKWQSDREKTNQLPKDGD